MAGGELLSNQITLQQALEENFDNRLNPGAIFELKEELFADGILFDETCAELAVTQLELRQQKPDDAEYMEAPLTVDPFEYAREVGALAARLSSMLSGAVDVARYGYRWPFSIPSAAAVLIAKENVQRRMGQENIDG